MKRYLVVIEKGGRNFSAFCPDLPGCVATGDTRQDIRGNMRSAILFHIEGLKKDGLPVPPQTTTAKFIEV